MDRMLKYGNNSNYLETEKLSFGITVKLICIELYICQMYWKEPLETVPISNHCISLG